MYFLARESFRKDDEWTVGWRIKSILLALIMSWVVLAIVLVWSTVDFIGASIKRAKANWDKEAEW